MKKKKLVRTRRIIIGSTALATLIGGIIFRSGILVIAGVLGLVTTLQFTQLDRYNDSEQTEMYLPMYKKWWGDDEKPDKKR